MPFQRLLVDGDDDDGADQNKPSGNTVKDFLGQSIGESNFLSFDY